MSLDWETTIEDVWGVLRHYGGSHDYEAILDMLDHDMIDKAALSDFWNIDVDVQTNNAFAEIERQLRNKHILPIDAFYWQNIAELGRLSHAT